MPTISDATYTIFDKPFSITLKPKYAQDPNCGYTANMEFTWTIPPLAPIYRTSDPYTLQVTTSNTKQVGVNTVFLQNKITYKDATYDQNWIEIESYDITIVNPCINTELYYENTKFTNMTYEV